jgi:hypothetical protein
MHAVGGEELGEELLNGALVSVGAGEGSLAVIFFIVLANSAV